MNDYTVIEMCRACENKNSNLHKIHHIHPIPVAGMYTDIGDANQGIRAPITLIACHHCGLVQLNETINPGIYNNYSFAGSTTPTYNRYLEQLSHKLVQQQGITNKKVCEVGAGDGTFLKHLMDNGNNQVLGIEPSAKLCEFAKEKGINMQKGFFNDNYIEEYNLGKYDCVIIRHVLEHIDLLNEMVSCLKRILTEDGLLVVEVPNFESTLQFDLFSNVFHEHLNYFTTYSLQNLFSKHGFSIVYTEQVDIHGGSLLLFLKLRPTVVMDSNQSFAFEQIEQFSIRAQAYYQAINQKITSLIQANKVVHGFGASHRTFVLMGNSGLDRLSVPVIYDNNPFLQNKQLLGLGSIVYPIDLLRRNKHPDAIIIFATSYEDEIIRNLIEERYFKGAIISLKYEVLVHG